MSTVNEDRQIVSDWDARVRAAAQETTPNPSRGDLERAHLQLTLQDPEGAGREVDARGRIRAAEVAAGAPLTDDERRRQAMIHDEYGDSSDVAQAVARSRRAQAAKPDRATSTASQPDAPSARRTASSGPQQTPRRR